MQALFGKHAGRILMQLPALPYSAWKRHFSMLVARCSEGAVAQGRRSGPVANRDMFARQSICTRRPTKHMITSPRGTASGIQIKDPTSPQLLCVERKAVFSLRSISTFKHDCFRENAQFRPSRIDPGASARTAAPANSTPGAST